MPIWGVQKKQTSKRTGGHSVVPLGVPRSRYEECGRIVKRRRNRDAQRTVRRQDALDLAQHRFAGMVVQVLGIERFAIKGGRLRPLPEQELGLSGSCGVPDRRVIGVVYFPRRSAREKLAPPIPRIRIIP